jgi:nucleotide-binding universal stress UspA family protein
MIERILLYVDSSAGTARAAAWTLKLAHALSSRVFAVAITEAIEGSGRTRPAGTDPEEMAWEVLYGIEDDAFGQNVRISLLLEQGDPLRHVLHLAASYEADLVVASADSRLPALELVKQSTHPVVFVK